jgi:hypothetical protein
MKTKMKKEFDCIEFKRQVQSEMYEETRDMSAEEFLEYLRRRVEEGPGGEWWISLRHSLRSRRHPSGLS